MVFSSALFLFAFLPVTYILCNIFRNNNIRNNILVVFSLLFYSFGRLDWLALIVISSLCNYLAGISMKKFTSAKKLVLVAALCVNLGVLAVFKYLNFFTASLNMLPFVNITPTNIALPIGISFFTFQGMSYVIDVYRNPPEASKSFAKVLLYISFFPQLVAGPIVKYSDISHQIDQRQTTADLTMSGIRRFVVGLSKKLFFANTFGIIADAVYGMDASICDYRLAWLGVIGYVLQIYYDFSAYSDMAIGLGRIFGFSFIENFNYPYVSKSITEFWRRWHISLSSWFRDYLYIPLGGNRKGSLRTVVNRFMVFFFTGMWHGANWTFILWGLWHGLFLFAEDIARKKNIRIPVVGHIYTMWVVAMGFMLFRADTIADAWNMLRSMYGAVAVNSESVLVLHNLFTPRMIVALVAGIIGVMPVADFVRNKLPLNGKWWQIAGAATVTVLFVLCIIKLAASSFNPFIYTQF